MWGIEVGLNMVDHEFYIDVSDVLMLVICLEDDENGCSPAELECALQHGGHKHALSNESPQAVKRDVLHAKGLRDDAAHCSSYTLALWDCQQRTEVLRQEGRLGTAWSGHKNTSRTRRRRSRSSSRHCSRMLSHRDWSGYSCCSPPNMLPRFHCEEPLSPSSNTMPKLSSAMNVLAYAQSSRSVGEMAQASLDDNEVGEDDFQTPHTPVHHKTLEEIDRHWRAKRWIQVAIQDITDEEVPWHELVTPLTSGVEGMARSVAKCLVTAWQWNIKVQGEGKCPPAPSVLNISHVMA